MLSRLIILSPPFLPNTLMSYNVFAFNQNKKGSTLILIIYHSLINNSFIISPLSPIFCICHFFMIFNFHIFKIKMIY